MAVPIQSSTVRATAKQAAIRKSSSDIEENSSKLVPVMKNSMQKQEEYVELIQKVEQFWWSTKVLEQRRHLLNEVMKKIAKAPAAALRES